MANVKDLKVRIKSTKSTLKITSAMKLVSAAKLSKAQQKIVGFRPYSNELTKTVKTASALAENYTHEYLESNEATKEVLLIVSSEKGLCGGYNSQLFKAVMKHVNSSAHEVELVFVGKKVMQLLQREDGLTLGEKFEFEKTDPTFIEIREVATKLAKRFTDNDIGKLSIAYNSFVSAIEFNSTIQQVLPMQVSEEEKRKLEAEFPVDFIYEPNAETILDDLIPEVLNSSIYTYILDAIAAEHASRMAAMDNATKNSQEMIRSLSLKMNKLRQAAITTELTEIVSGAESLNS